MAGQTVTNDDSTETHWNSRAHTYMAHKSAKVFITDEKQIGFELG